MNNDHLPIIPLNKFLNGLAKSKYVRQTANATSSCCKLYDICIKYS
jgi:hypothetical protein